MMYGKSRSEGMFGYSPYGPGGIGATKRNPNKYTEVNDSPSGPYAHEMGYTGDGGVHGGEKVSSKGNDFWFA